jgi:outer membrane protein OmpA-like peptidoglycan-associated protein/tetratricopeptide (TPR) repeat protein
MKKRPFITALFFIAFGVLSAQKGSKADQYYFEYAYKEAVRAYQEEMKQYSLSPAQELNLADSYFRIGQFDQAAETFLQVYKKDSLMTNAQFNTMLQALSRTSGPDRAKAFLSTRSDQLSEALMENTAFNYEVLEDAPDSGSNYRIFPLGINSKQSDFAPAFFGANQLLFSSSRPLAAKETYMPSGESYMDIYVTTVQGDGQASMPSAVPWIPRIKYHQATPFYSESLDALFYVRSNMDETGSLAFDPGGKNALGIVRAGRDGAFRTLFRDLGTSFYYPFFDSATGKLYFAADFNMGYGGTDLYYVYTNNGQIMSEPVNLGPQINTPGNEISPYIFEGSLYFASDVFYGLGGMDIYKAEVQEGDFFSIPVNLGAQVNSPMDDFGFIIKADPNGGYSGYFSSNREGGIGKDDLYGFTVDQKPGMKTLVVQGTVQDLSGMGVSKAFVRLLGPEGKLIRETYSGEDGAFRLEIPMRDSVSVQVGRDRYETLDLGSTASRPDLVGKPLKIQLTPLEAVVLQQTDQTLLRVDRFHFRSNSDQVTPEIAAILDQAAVVLNKFPSLRIRIEAHTDSRGSATNNLQLSQRRAQAIRDYLISKGVAPETLAEVAGYGEAQILNNCTDGVYCLEVLHKQNERYPFVVLNYSDL